MDAGRIEELRNYVASMPFALCEQARAFLVTMLWQKEHARQVLNSARWVAFCTGYAHGYRQALSEFRAGRMLTIHDYERVLMEGPKDEDTFALDCGGDLCGDGIGRQ